MPRFVEWYDRYNSLAVNFIGQFFENKKKNYDCMDNFRVARTNDKKALKQYDKRQQNGCCGYFDTEIIAPDLKTYKVGFNYGH